MRQAIGGYKRLRIVSIDKITECRDNHDQNHSLLYALLYALLYSLHKTMISFNDKYTHINNKPINCKIVDSLLITTDTYIKYVEMTLDRRRINSFDVVLMIILQTA